MILNCTPHPITLDNGINKVTYKPVGEPIRLEKKSYMFDSIGGFPIYKQIVVGSNLPDKVDRVHLLVSSMVMDAYPDRDDLLAPESTNPNRNSKGYIESVKGFVKNV